MSQYDLKAIRNGDQTTLSWRELHEAALAGAALTGADLRDADLSGAEHRDAALPGTVTRRDSPQSEQTHTTDSHDADTD
jgi:uncharacterized protein YjbI with pentapeptide repeats